MNQVSKFLFSFIKGMAAVLLVPIIIVCAAVISITIKRGLLRIFFPGRSVEYEKDLKKHLYKSMFLDTEANQVSLPERQPRL